MITHDRATLAIYSDATTAASITRILRLSPTRSGEKGDAAGRPAVGRDGSLRAMGEPRAHWSLDADTTAADESDETGFRTLRVLLDVLSSRAQQLAVLRETCETVIWWSGDSDSSQGGFVLPVSMIQDLASLGCDLHGTTFVSEHEE